MDKHHHESDTPKGDQRAAARRLVRLWRLCRIADGSSGALRREALRAISEEIVQERETNPAKPVGAMR